MNYRKTLAVFVLFVTTSTFAGELTPVKIDSAPEESRVMGPLVWNRFAKPGPDAGTVSPHAVVAVGHGMQIAIDSTTPDGSPNVVRIDFAGTGNFADASTVPIEMQQVKADEAQNRPEYTFGVVEGRTFQATVADKPVSVYLDLYYYKRKAQRQMSAIMAWAAEGECTFGETTCAIRVYYGSPSLSTRIISAVIDPSGKDFGEDAISVLQHQPIYMDGKFYRLHFTGWKVAAEALDIEAAKVQIPADRWRLDAVLDDRTRVIYQGGRDPVMIPAGTYQRFSLALSGPGKACMVYGYDRQEKLLQAPAGKTTTWQFGGPLTAKITPQVGDSKVRFSLQLLDAAGIPVASLKGKDGLRLPAPGLQVAAEGKLVYSAKMEYG